MSISRIKDADKLPRYMHIGGEFARSPPLVNGHLASILGIFLGIRAAHRRSRERCAHRREISGRLIFCKYRIWPASRPPHVSGDVEFCGRLFFILTDWRTSHVCSEVKISGRLFSGRPIDVDRNRDSTRLVNSSFWWVRKWSPCKNYICNSGDIFLICEIY